MVLIEEIENVVRPVLLREGFELVETIYRRESGKMILRIFMDKAVDPGIQGQSLKGSRVTLNDCEKMSETIGIAVDASGVLADSYVLEVSSPGINRLLKNENHFQNYIGEKVKVSLYTPLDLQKNQRNFSGILLDCKEQEIEVQDVVSGKVKIPLSNIAKAHLDLI